MFLVVMAWIIFRICSGLLVSCNIKIIFLNIVITIIIVIIAIIVIIIIIIIIIMPAQERGPFWLARFSSNLHINTKLAGIFSVQSICKKKRKKSPTHEFIC